MSIRHYHYNYKPPKKEKEFVVSSIVSAAVVAAGWAVAGSTTAAVMGGIGAALVYGGIATTIGMSMYNSRKQRKAQKSAAHAADMRAKEIVKKQKEAKATAEKEAREMTRRRLVAIEGSDTHLTRNQELEEPLIQTPTLLGA